MEDQSEEKKAIEEAVTEAKDILKGKQADSETCLKLAIKLIGKDRFNWARRLLDRVMERGIDKPELRTRIVQKRVLATYKDTSLNRDQALDRAVDILDRELGLTNTKVHETLGLAGAIYKRKWDVDAHKSNLERSLRYYRRGYEAGLEADDGYTAINAAYILDLLAHLEEKDATETGGIAKTAADRREEAGIIRNNIIGYLGGILDDAGEKALTKDNYWKVVTLAEAYFGMQDYSNASKWLEKARKIDGISEWEYATSAKQLTHLAQLQTGLDLTGPELEQTPAWQALIGFLGDNADALRTLFQGKVGLALSGGGFRASLYHIGVLAKLAELDLLRHVEVLSCVSGGLHCRCSLLPGAQAYVPGR